MPTIRASDNSWRGKIRRYKTARGLCAQYRRLLGEAVLNLNLEQVFFMNSKKNQSNHYYPILKGQHNNTYRHVRSFRQSCLQGIQLATSGTWSASNSLLRWMIDYIINCQIFDTFGKLIIKLMQWKQSSISEIFGWIIEWKVATVVWQSSDSFVSFKF